ncbi:MAG TPA: nuclear transport factor 2 family protein [Candidatus Aquilonibacter sp.]|nr:nuclear transport factor 2 family protein [Candidatus Aquilonibacter sp.]
MPMKTSTVELLADAYDVFNRRDIEKILGIMHPNVDWPNGMEGGRVRGRDAVREYWRRQWSMVDPEVKPVAFEDDEKGRTVVDVHQVVRDLDGKIILDRVVQHVYSVRDSQIERMEIRESAEENPERAK